jgi:histidinol-phosphate aminotransferase
MKSYFRPEIDAMAGYVPGEQPRMLNLVKLNTNENPYPPTPHIQEALSNIDIARLRRYPDPVAKELREEAAKLNNTTSDCVIFGNGSDDILTMIFRAFSSPQLSVATLYPSYSLYGELAAMQGAKVISIPLVGNNFALPEDILTQAKEANILLIVRPNAPTGTLFPKEDICQICENFDGIVVIDEAYADFAKDNCMDLPKIYNNVIVLRTFSKSYALAGIRLGYAVANPEIITGLMKLKDSYNVDMITQIIGLAALKDQEYFKARLEDVKTSRATLKAQLENLGFEVPESESNFLFAAPPDRNGQKAFEILREAEIIVRFFNKEVTKDYIRITIGTPEENNRLVSVLAQHYPAK